jgi:hypothetical protein
MGTFSHLSCTPSRDPSTPCVSVPNRATWAGTSTRPSLLPVPHPQSSGRRPLRLRTDSPLRPAPRSCLAPLRPAPCLAPFHPVPRFASRNPRRILEGDPSKREIVFPSRPCDPHRVLRQAIDVNPAHCTAPAPYDPCRALRSSICATLCNSH